MSERNSELDRAYDSVFLHARRETFVLLIAFAFFLLWSVGASYLLGYRVEESAASSNVMGVPRWVFWGVCVPWLGADVFTIWFAWFFMANDPLGEALDEQNADASEVQR